MEHDVVIPILLVEDNPADVEAIQRKLQKGGIGNPIHIARDGQEALDFLNHRRATFLVIILDVQLPKVNGIEVLREITKFDLEAVVIMLTGHPSLETAIQSLRHGVAFDYLQKSKEDLPGLIDAVKLALEKGSIRLQNHWEIHDKGMSQVVNLTAIQNQFGLSNREMDLVKCLCSGYTNREIGEQLFISELTVKGHLKNIFQKMEIHNRATLISKILSSSFPLSKKTGSR